MSGTEPFKWKHYEAKIILQAVRWYLSYPLSYRNLEEMLAERGLAVVHTTIMRWVHQYGPEIERRARPKLRPAGDSWKVDETYVRVRGHWMYLYRAVGSSGQTIDFWLSPVRDMGAAKRFLRKALRQGHTGQPRVLNTDGDKAYPPAIRQLKTEGVLAESTHHRQVKYLNNLIEQDHRGIKRITRPMMGFHGFVTAAKTLSGIETMRMLYKNQLRDQRGGTRLQMVSELFKVAG